MAGVFVFTIIRITKDRIKKEALSLNPKYENASGTIPLHQMVAMDIGAQYLASLNDMQFFGLISQAKLITPEQAESLQRKYSTFDFRAEHEKHAAWNNISKLQKIEEQENQQATKKKSGKGLLDRFLSR